MPVYEHFISYRRSDSLHQAAKLYEELRRRGFATFCDVHSLQSGDFEERIATAIRTCTNFILVLSPTSLDRCTGPDDWVYKELALAMEFRKNIVIVHDGLLTIPEALPIELRQLRRMNGLEYEIVYFKEFVSRLVSQFLITDSELSSRSDFRIEGDVLLRYVGAAVSARIPDGVAVVGAGAFKDCTQLEAVELPPTLREVGDGAFERCLSLESIALPPMVRSVGDRAFRRCYALAHAELNAELVSIGAEAFGFCESLRRIDIPTYLESLGAAAFDGCARLAEITVSQESATFMSHDGLLLTRDGTRLIRCPEGMRKTQITVSDSVSEIAPHAFANCARLTSLVLPVDLHSVGAAAFRNCTGLTQLDLPGSVTAFDPTALDGWTELQQVVTEAGYSRSIRRTIDETLDVSSALQSPSAKYIAVKITFESSGEAQSAAHLLLTHGLIASGQITKIQANYWWEGEVQAEDEYELTCYSRAALYPRLERVIIEAHSYEVPQVVAMPLVSISRAFGDWISEYTREFENGAQHD